MPVLSNQINIVRDSIIQVLLKYELRTSKSKRNLNSNTNNFTLKLCLKLIGNNVTVPINSIYQLVYKIILEKYICPIQIKNIRWKFMTITNLSDPHLVVRLPIMSCCGHLDVPLSNISPKDNYTYHLYHKSLVPLKFSLKGIPINLVADSRFHDKLYAISNIFVEKLPIVGLESKESYFKFVKKNSNLDASFNSDNYKEIESSYPWGFVTYKPRNNTNVKSKTIRKKKK